MSKIEKPEIPDYENLYYKVMKENTLLKSTESSFNFNTDEINVLKNIMYHVLKDMQYDFDEDGADEDEKIGKKEKIFHTMAKEKKFLIERIVKKLRFEIKNKKHD